MGKRTDKLIGTKADRKNLIDALKNAPHCDTDADPRNQASQTRIRNAEARLPRLGRAIARDRSL